MSAHSDNVKTIFGHAIEIADQAEREAYLDKACGDNAALRNEVDGLLDALKQASGFLDMPNAEQPSIEAGDGNEQTQTFDSAPVDEQTGVVIAGRYSLVEQIGEGGMGAVWRARQTEPVKRNVAIKLIKAGMDSRQVLARFDAERQALALMDHPNIAKVLDGGLHNQRPYFVMELVKGIPITEYCDLRKLTPDERLNLFIPVCHAIQHAHQKGIIHRDIKPSNVLVAMYDDRPVVKVIDFGLAKATGGVLTEQTLDTGFGSVLGTPQYMSPEQATFNNLDIDTRSDVYALGVLLYEMLTGSPPFGKEELEAKGFLEMLRAVREDEPPIPSMRLSTTDALPSLSANRSMEPKKLTGLMRQDLDWVVMKAIEKERSRRYETANDLAADIERFLNHDVVQAHPPSRAYLFKKFVRRHKSQVIGVSALVLVLIAGMIGTSIGMFEALRQKKIARQETVAKEAAVASEAERAKAEEKAKLEAKEKQALAESQRAIAVAVKSFLQDKLLGQADAANQADALLKTGDSTDDVKWNPTIHELLDRAAEELGAEHIESSFPNQPLLQAELLLTVGRSYLGISEPKKAFELLQRSFDIRKEKLGEKDSETLTSMQALAESYLLLGEYDMAVDMLKKAIEIREEVSGPTHTSTFDAMLKLGYAYESKGEYKLALDHYEKLRKISATELNQDSADNKPTNRQVLDALSCLANVHKELGNLEQSLELHREAVDRLQTLLTIEHRTTLAAMSNLASAYNESGKLDLALPLYKKTLRYQEKILGPTSRETLSSMNNLGLGYLNTGESEQALQIFKETLARKEAKWGRDHKQSIPTIHNLALAYANTNEVEKAINLAEESLGYAKNHFGPGDGKTLRIMSSLSQMYQTRGDVEQAVALMKEVVDAEEKQLPENHPTLIADWSNLGFGYIHLGKFDLAIPLLEKAVKAGRATKLASNHRIFLAALQNLAHAYKSSGRLDAAIPLLEEVLQNLRDNPVADKTALPSALNNLAVTYWQVKQLDKSIPMFKETLEKNESLLGRKAIHTQVVLANLGINYRDAGQVDEAIPMIEEAYQNLKSQPSLQWVGEQLLETYAKAGKSEKLKKLIKERLTMWRKLVPPESVQLAGILAQYSLVLLKDDSFNEAKPLVEECLAIRQKEQPDVWSTYNTVSMMGDVHLRLKDLKAAEPLLLKGYEGLKEHQASIPMPGQARIPEALGRLVKLYKEMDKNDEADRWQKILDATENEAKNASEAKGNSEAKSANDSKGAKEK